MDRTYQTDETRALQSWDRPDRVHKKKFELLSVFLVVLLTASARAMDFFHR
jgi:hypothetical protein